IFKPYNKSVISNYFETTLKNENTIAYIAKEDENLLAYILLLKIKTEENPFQYSRNYLLIDQILVNPNHQNKGIGRLLLETAIQFAKRNNIQTIELNHWSKNDTARRFFNKFGFEYYNEKMWK